MLNEVTPVLPPHTEYMYGYDQEVVSRKLEGEVGGAEVDGPQDNEKTEHWTQEQRAHFALRLEERHRTEKALRGHEEKKHRREEERHRRQEERYGKNAGWHHAEAEYHHGTKEERCDEKECIQEDRI